jgi:hypothetical protein
MDARTLREVLATARRASEVARDLSRSNDLQIAIETATAAQRALADHRDLLKMYRAGFSGILLPDAVEIARAIRLATADARSAMDGLRFLTPDIGVTSPSVGGFGRDLGSAASRDKPIVRVARALQATPRADERLRLLTESEPQSTGDLFRFIVARLKIYLPEGLSGSQWNLFAFSLAVVIVIAILTMDAAADGRAERAQQARDLDALFAASDPAFGHQFRATQWVTLRQFPDGGSARVGSLPAGSILSLRTTVGQWMYVEATTGQRGWVPRRVVRRVR